MYRFLIFLSFVGCTDYPCEGSFRLTPSITVREEGLINQAVERWNGLLQGAPISVTPTGRCPIEYDDTNYTATYKHAGRIVLSESKLRGESDANFRQAIMHEIGHSLELDHVPQDIPAVMNAEVSGIEDFTEADRAEAARVGLTLSERNVY